MVESEITLPVELEGCCGTNKAAGPFREEIVNLEALKASEDDPSFIAMVKEEIVIRLGFIEQICLTCPNRKNGQEQAPVTGITCLPPDLKKIFARRVITPTEALSLARRCGLAEGHGGRHYSIKAPSGARFALPRHPGDLSPGVTRSFFNFLEGVVIGQQEILT